MIILMDANKTFNTIQYPFMIKILNKVGIKGNNFNLVKGIYLKLKIYFSRSSMRLYLLYVLWLYSFISLLVKIPRVDFVLLQTICSCLSVFVLRLGANVQEFAKLNTQALDYTMQIISQGDYIF